MIFNKASRLSVIPDVLKFMGEDQKRFVDRYSYAWDILETLTMMKMMIQFVADVYVCKPIKS